MKASIIFLVLDKIASSIENCKIICSYSLKQIIVSVSGLTLELELEVQPCSK